MNAFNGSQEYKDQLVEAAIDHRIADHYTKGTYGEGFGKNFRACSIGCSISSVNKLKGKCISSSDHEALAAELGIPVFIPRLADTIFENLPDTLHIEWTERWISAIPVGADLSKSLPIFLIKTLDRLPETDRADVVAAIKSVRDVLVDWQATGAPNEAAEAAAWAAEAAAWAAEAAAWAAEAAAAWAAARAAAWAAEAAAAWAAARAAEAAAAAARAAEAAAARAAAAEAAEAAWEQIANDLIDSILECSKPTSITEVVDNYDLQPN